VNPPRYGVLAQSTTLGFQIARVDTRHLDQLVDGRQTVAVTLELQGAPSVQQLTVDLNDLDGVLEVETTDRADTTD
jgi:hypothetical protein